MQFDTQHWVKILKWVQNVVPNASFRPRTFPSIGETSIAEMSQSADSRKKEWLRKVRKLFVGKHVW